MPRTLVVIPARMASTRLPNKPLADIGGEPMIVGVWRRAMAADVGRVVVATDSEHIDLEFDLLRHGVSGAVDAWKTLLPF